LYAGNEGMSTPNITGGLRKFTLGKNRIEFTLECSDIVSSIDLLVKLYTFPVGYASGSCFC
jgi:hypothetical protein